MTSIAVHRARFAAPVLAQGSSGNVEIDQIVQMLRWGQLVSKTQRHDPRTDTDFTDYRYMGGNAMVFELADGTLYPFMQIGSRGRLYYPQDMLREARRLGYTRFRGAESVVVEGGRKTRVYKFEEGKVKYTFKDGEGPDGPTLSFADALGSPRA